MASRRTKEMHEETISKEEFLDVVNRLVKLEEWVKETEAQNKKDKEEKDMLMVQLSNLKLDNINLQKLLQDIATTREDGEISSLEDIKDEIKKVKEEVRNDMELAKTGQWVNVKRYIKKELI